jgi:DNA recombination protein RmuC
MSESLILILSIVVTAIFAGIIGYKFSSLKLGNIKEINKEKQLTLEQQILDLKQNTQNIEQEYESLRTDKDTLHQDLIRKDAELQHLKAENLKREKDLKTQQEHLRNEFKLLADTILEEKSNKFTEQNKKNIESILTPLKEKILTFEKKVETTHKENYGLHESLKTQLNNLKDLNQQMTKEATNLTKALKGDSKTQGNWGELVLERVLEKSGLEKDREYKVQQNHTLESGARLVPDVVLYLPGDKKMIIDSKVSLTHYERMVNSDDETRSKFLQEHIRSIKKHVEQLSAKNYQDLYGISSPDFVLMFIPIEPAFAVAINEDNTLYTSAFEKNIVIVTPSTLLATLRTIDSMWTNEKQQQNAIEIARQAGALYDKFDGLISDLTGIGKKMEAAKTDYMSAMNKLVDGKGNLVSRVENLKKMGAKAKKSLPENIIKRSVDDEL